MSNLIISQKYNFRVIAENKKGEGKVGDASREVEAIGKNIINIFVILNIYTLLFIIERTVVLPLAWGWLCYFIPLLTRPTVYM